MNQLQMTAGNDNASRQLRATNARVPEQWLLPVRIGIIIVALLAFLIFLVSLLLDYAQFRTICTITACADGQLTLQSARTLEMLHVSLDAYAVINLVLLVIQALVYYGVAALIFWHKSNEWLAVCVIVGFLAGPTNSLSEPIAALPPAGLAVLTIVQYLGVATFILICYLFPTGRFVPRWTILIAANALVIAGFQAFLPNIAWPPGPAALNWVIAFSTLAFAQIYRYRKVSSSEQRQQTKWVVFGLTVAVMLELINRLLPLIFPSLAQHGGFYSFFSYTLSAYGFLLIPLTIGIAILRYRLWDIDIIIKRTIVYGILTACVIGIYILVVGYLGALVHTGSNLVISLLATGLVAVLFQPLRELLQRGVNRLFYGQRDEPYRVISQLGQRLEATLAPDAVLAAIVETVAQALKLPYTAISLKHDQAFSIAASYGTEIEPFLSVPLMYQTEQVGELLLAPRSRGESFTPADRRLLEDLARQVGVAVHTIRLTADLQQSRERLVNAREEERRRLRRDLHDGLGPALASITLKLDAARNLLIRDLPAADALLIDLKKQTQAAVSDIRRLVYDLRPPSLDELGLIQALHEQTEQYNHDGLRITIDAPEPLPALPAAAEVATYRIVQEAMTNVVRHSQACNCTIRFAFDHDLDIEICDDGRGISTDQRAGVGLTSIRERVAELGGICEIETQPVGGTRLHVRLPLSKSNEREEAIDGTDSRPDRG
jgi:signal transduction histidine kinase